MSRIRISLFLLTILLCFIGIFILYESSTYIAYLDIGDAHYYIKNQVLWVFLGIILALVISKLDYRKLYFLSLPGLIFSLCLLLLVFVPGIGLEFNGAHRWIYFGLFVVQPSEILKITMSLYLAAWLSHKEKGRLAAFLMLFGAAILLVALEPDLGTSLIIASSCLSLYFLSGARLREMGLIFVIFVAGAILLVMMEPYRISRLTTFSNFNEKDLSGASYHVKQILIALGSSGVGGVGLGNSIQKYAYVPEHTTDSIFAIYAEETGFIGSFFLISIFLCQLLLGFIISMRVKDQFGKLLSSGILVFLGVQTLVNLASQAVLIPLTGVPLPFVSYGGSSMLINFSAIGILLAISKRAS